MSAIRIENLSKQYGAVSVLKDINLQIDSGEFVVFVGPSGCGKSTLLRCISGLESISAGEISIDGEVINDVPPAHRGIAMVFQSYALYPHMTVFQNIAYALRIAGLPKREQRQRVQQVAEKLQLTDYLERYPKALSGGQRQRVAIGRAIVRDPKVFLFDEPLSNLDAALRVQMRLEISALKVQLPHTTMIYVTHDQVEAMTMADKIVVMRDGVVEQVGSPLELYDTPRTEFVAGFIGSPRMNFLGGDYAQKFGAARIGIRPEHLTIAPDAPWSGTVTHVERLGSDTFAYITLGHGDLLTTRMDGKAAIAQGQQITVGPSGPVYRFGQDGLAQATE
ncbi:MAG TPA: ABC transporter ATP-binding protein [Devosia sp.]|nr:ABC transporter ATP-binding protein [Devosia sp.]